MARIGTCLNKKRGPKRKNAFMSEYGKFYTNGYGKLIRMVRDLSNGKWYRNWVGLDYSRQLREYGDLTEVIIMADSKVSDKRIDSLFKYKHKRKGKQVVEFVESERKRFIHEESGVVII
jgi:hypothetical protein